MGMPSSSVSSLFSAPNLLDEPAVSNKEVSFLLFITATAWVTDHCESYDKYHLISQYAFVLLDQLMLVYLCSMLNHKYYATSPDYS